MAAIQTESINCRFPSFGQAPSVLDDIFRDDINIAVWERTLDAQLKEAVNGFLQRMPRLKSTITVSPSSAEAAIVELSKGAAPSILVNDMVALVERYCELFNLDEAVLRLETLTHVMCPRFHVDWVPCRLLTSYSSVTTEWLADQSVDRSKLGSKSNGVPDAASGLYQTDKEIQRLSRGSVALFKGECWPDNEGAGLVHRSPRIPKGDNRLLLTINMVK